MTEQTSNVLLKELEEPPERTVWILCAPSEADLIPTIRSRVRTVRLQVPTRRRGRRPPRAPRRRRRRARRAGRARGAEPHRHGAPARHQRGGARPPRRDAAARARGPLGGRPRSSTAARFLEIAGDDAKAITELRDAEEREHALHSLGLAPGPGRAARAAPAAQGPRRRPEAPRHAQPPRRHRPHPRRPRVALPRHPAHPARAPTSTLVNRELLDPTAPGRGIRHARRARSRRSTPSRRRASASRATCSPRSRSRRCSSPPSAPPTTERGAA